MECRYTAADIQISMLLFCILLSSHSSQDRMGIKGVAGTVGRWCLLCSVVGNGASTSGGAVDCSAGGSGRSKSMCSWVKERAVVMSSGCGCAVILKEGGMGESCFSGSWEGVFVVTIIIVVESGKSRLEVRSFVVVSIIVGGRLL